MLWNCYRAARAWAGGTLCGSAARISHLLTHAVDLAVGDVDQRAQPRRVARRLVRHWINVLDRRLVEAQRERRHLADELAQVLDRLLVPELLVLRELDARERKVRLNLQTERQQHD